MASTLPSPSLVRFPGPQSIESLKHQFAEEQAALAREEATLQASLDKVGGGAEGELCLRRRTEEKINELATRGEGGVSALPSTWPLCGCGWAGREVGGRN